MEHFTRFDNAKYTLTARDGFVSLYNKQTNTHQVFDVVESELLIAQLDSAITSMAQSCEVKRHG